MKGNSEKENEHSIHICPHFISLLRVGKAKKLLFYSLEKMRNMKSSEFLHSKMDIVYIMTF